MPLLEHQKAHSFQGQTAKEVCASTLRLRSKASRRGPSLPVHNRSADKDSKWDHKIVNAL